MYQEENEMPNTFTQIYVHYVFATMHRMRLMNASIQQEIYSYTSGITKELNCFMQCIGGMDDHMHLLVGLHPTMAVSVFAQKVKANSSRFINENGWALGKFAWQDGFGAFSVSQSGLAQVRDYIKNQANHHQQRSFLGEYEELLIKYMIEYDKQHLFKPCSE